VDPTDYSSEKTDSYVDENGNQVDKKVKERVRVRVSECATSWSRQTTAAKRQTLMWTRTATKLTRR
jgi:hypothetical protein